MGSFMRKILMSGLVAATAVLGCAGAGLAEAGTTGTTGTAGPVTATVKGDTAETAFRQAIAASYPAGRAAGRIAASYLGRLAAQPPASASTSNITTGSKISCASPTACLSIGVHEVSAGTTGTMT